MFPVAHYDYRRNSSYVLPADVSSVFASLAGRFIRGVRFKKRQWRFIVVEDSVGRQALAECMEESNPGRKALMGAPLVIVLCTVPAESEVWEGKDFMMLDAGLAMEQTPWKER